MSATIEYLTNVAAEPKKLVLVKEADYFCFGREDEACALATTIFKDVFKVNNEGSANCVVR